MDSSEKEIRKELDDLFDQAKTIEDIKGITYIVDEYIEEGYDLRDYVGKCNEFVQQFYAKNPEE